MKRTLPTVVLSILLFSLQNINLECLDKEKTAICLILQHLDNQKSIYGLFILTLFIVYNYLVSRNEQNRTKKNLRAFLSNFFKKNLNRDKKNHRITVFQTKRGCWFFFGYLIHTVARFKYYKNCDKLWIRLKKTPIPWVKYLTVLSRYGMPNENFKATIFKLSKSEQLSDCMAVYAYHRGQIEHVKLPKISTIDFKKNRNLKDLSPSNQSKVRSYMKKSHITNLDTLRILGKRPEYIGAIPIFAKGGKLDVTSHVIMYDSDALDFKYIKEEITSLSKYIEIILINS